mgnify:CR=1 FL=1
MDNIFNELKKYAGTWHVKSERNLSEEELKTAESAVVVGSSYGSSVQITLKNGDITFIPLSRDSALGIGEEVDLTKAKLITLCKSGEMDIIRLFI